MSPNQPSADEREVVSYIPQMILRYVAEAQGRRAAETVLRASGLGALGPAVWDRTRWWSVAEVLALAEAAAAQTGDPDIGRRAGETLLRASQENETQSWQPASVLAALEESLERAGKMSSGCVYELLAPERDGELFFAGHYRDPSRTDRFFCSFTAGYYSQLPSLLGARAVVTEPECQFRGDERCLFRLRWWPTSTAEARQPATKPTGAADMFSLARFEELQAMAAELVEADDVTSALDRITYRAGSALQAPRYILAVRTGEDDPLRVHHFGFSSDASARDFATSLLAGKLSAADGVAAVTVGSSRRSFGQLAAVFAPGVRVNGYDLRLLEAYAGHAAAALDVVCSLAAARRDRDTAEALLSLPHRMTKTTDADDIARWLAGAVPAVTNADKGAVWLCEGATSMRLAASDAGGPGASFHFEVDPESLKRLAGVTRPFWIDAERSAPLRPVLDQDAFYAAGVVPIRSGKSLVGLVVAGFAHPPSEFARSEVMARLGGLGDHASLAFGHAALVADIRRQALHDELTGLPNRRLMADRAGQAVRHAARARSGLALLFLDLDRFKVVNDSLGHAAGDELLVAVAERLADISRDSDTLARLGGDEFVVLATELGSEQEAVALAERILRAMATPFRVAERELYVSASIGVAHGRGPGVSLDNLMRRADVAMYGAKSSGGATYSLDASRAVAHRHRLQLETELHRALDKGELRVFYQPQFRLRTGELIGAEALVRWQHPERGLLLPGEFLPVAEASGLVMSIDRFVRQEALAGAAGWARTGHSIRLALNLSGRDLRRPDLAALVGSEIEQSGVEPALVELEVTDVVPMGQTDLTHVLGRLQSLGVRLAIDDFGTGNSVLSRLHSFSVDTLKIDRRFVESVGANGDAPILRSIIELAHSVGSESLAEGVETEAQVAVLRRYGCELVQGFYSGRPVPGGDFCRSIKSDSVPPPGFLETIG